MNGKTLPVPMMNVLNGGAHASNNVDIQEFMIMPVGASSFPRSLTHVCRGLPHAEESGSLHRRGRRRRLRAPNLASDEDALKALVEAIEKSGYKPGEDFMIAMDAAVSEWYNKEKRSV